MDRPKYTTLEHALREIVDPRKARGKRYPRLFLLTLALPIRRVALRAAAVARARTSQGIPSPS